jgi:DHA1 family tetracycline resistance protein-like MFS transporter
MSFPTAAPSSSPFPLRPLLAANMACTMAMMAFVSLIGPIVRQVGLMAWQAGAAVTVGGVLWMLLARPWGAASDKHGRRKILLVGVGGFAMSYWAMAGVIDASLRLMPAALLVFIGLVITRGAIGAFYGAIPTAGMALVADHVPPARRAGTMAALGAANAVGMVVGPALAAMLAQHSLSLPLYLTGVLPIVAFIILWRALPRTPPVQHAQRATLKLNDLRLRRPMAVAFTAMFCVAIAQITVGFFAIDRLGLVGPAAAKAAGIALTAVGVSLVLSQMLVRKLKWQPQRMIYVGGLVSAVGFGAVALAESAPVLWACYFVAAAGMGWVFPAFSALAANAVEPHEQGAAAGTVGAAQGLGIVVGPLVGTVLYGVSPGTPYLLVGAMLAAVALWPTPEVKKPVEPSADKPADPA